MTKYTVNQIFTNVNYLESTQNVTEYFCSYQNLEKSNSLHFSSFSKNGLTSFCCNNLKTLLLLKCNSSKNRIKVQKNLIFTTITKFTVSEKVTSYICSYLFKNVLNSNLSYNFVNVASYSQKN